jgi:hypothetical protein
MDVRSSPRSGTEYLPVVVYEYDAGGRHHRGTRLYFGEAVVYNRKARAERRLATLATNAAIQVFYDPEQPSCAVVERSAPVLRRDVVLMAILGVVLVAVLVVLSEMRGAVYR